jgi:hypothetical protein
MVSLHQITKQVDKSNQVPRDEMINIQEDLKKIAVDGDVAAPSTVSGISHKSGRKI